MKARPGNSEVKIYARNARAFSVIIAIVVLWLIAAYNYGIYYQTNDDVIMSLMAQGKRLSKSASYLNGMQGCIKGLSTQLMPAGIGWMNMESSHSLACLRPSVP